MSSTPASNPSPAVPPKKRSVLGDIFWPVAIFVGVMLYIQWPAVKDLYYRVSGVEPPKSPIAWREDFAAASDEVSSSDKRMLLLFSATWCGPCNEMKRNVWSDPQVGEAVTAGFVPVHIDVDEHQEIAGRYQIHSIPAVLVLGRNGEVLARQAYMSRSEALEFLKAMSKPAAKPVKTQPTMPTRRAS